MLAHAGKSIAQVITNWVIIFFTLIVAETPFRWLIIAMKVVEAAWG
jgi:hypothetical protein